MRLVPAAILLAIIWSSVAHASVRPVYGGSARLGAEGPLSVDEPGRPAKGAGRLLARASHCTLAEVTASVEQLEGESVRIRLLPNLVFHDGTRLRAEDVASSLTRMARMDPPSPAAWRLLVIATEPGEAGAPAIEVKGETTLELRLVSSDPNLLAWLDDPALALTRADGRSACGAFVPQGPEQAVSPEEGISLTAFERHPRGRPFLDRLTIVGLETPGDRRIDLSKVDGASGPWLLPEGSSIEPDSTLVSLRLSPRLRSSSHSRLRLSEAVDREAMARFLLGPGARPIESLASLLEAGSGDEAQGRAAGEDEVPAVPPPGAALPTNITVGYEASSGLQRRLAERVQLRLHDQGVRAVLLPLDETRGSIFAGANIVIDLHEDLPECPLMRLVAIAHRHGGGEIARWALTALLPGSDPVDRAALATALQEAVGLIPLAALPARIWLHEDLQLAPGADKGLDPAELWRWPSGLPREQASPGTAR